MSHDCINATFNDPVVTYNLSRRDHQECTEFIFGVSAVGINGEVLQTYEVMGRYQQGLIDTMDRLYTCTYNHA